MRIRRSSGILLHPTSLPGPFGSGDLGPSAFRFADFLADSGQSWWQVLPLGPTGYGNSPYMCFSAFAGNPLLISPERLLGEELLAEGDMEAAPEFSEEHVEFSRVIEFRMQLLRKSFSRYRDRFRSGYPPEFTAFCSENAFWLDDYVLFRALKKVHGERIWTEWDEAAARRDPEAMRYWRAALDDDLQFGRYLEFMFVKQWRDFREYCRGKGIRIIGDLPIYVAHDSAEVWANRELFWLDAAGQPLVIAGVPPDYFSATGQRWGNPLYRWETRRGELYEWWARRMRATYALVDLVRIDHFRGFEAYWEIPASEPTAVHGQWKKGPGADFFEAMRDALPELPIIAEDLGVITPEVDSLRDRFEFPGMRILQMAFGTDPKASEYLPHSHVRNSVVYTATHDHNTTAGWFNAPPGKETTQTPEEIADERAHVLEYLGTDGTDIHVWFIRLAMGSVADLCIFPLQDLFGLGTKDRMNRPGTTEGNWEWRFTEEMLTPLATSFLKRMTRVYEREAGP